MIANGGTGAGSIVKTGSGTLTLSGANTYTGTTTVQEGELRLTRSTTHRLASALIEGQAHPACHTLTSTIPVAAPVEGAPPRDLTVREWVVERIDGRGVVDNSRTTLTFDPQGQLAGRAGCNRYTGSYQLQGAQFALKGVATTRMICVPALMEQEARFLKALDAANAWRLQPDGSLLLSGPDGRKLVLAR